MTNYVIDEFENCNTEKPYRPAGVNVQELIELASDQKKEQ